MNLTVIAVFVVGTLATVLATYCYDDASCERYVNRCCMALTASHLINKGLCVRKARERQRCSEETSAMVDYGGKYLMYCPCEEGLVCKPRDPAITKEANRQKYFDSLRCQREPSTTESSPTDVPETSPTDAPETSPTDAPETRPTDGPENRPTDAPETSPTDAPETSPTDAPETSPTDAPETSPTEVSESGETEISESGETEAPESDETDAPESGETDAPESGETDAPETDDIED